MGTGSHRSRIGNSRQGARYTADIGWVVMTRCTFGGRCHTLPRDRLTVSVLFPHRNGQPHGVAEPLADIGHGSPWWSKAVSYREPVAARRVSRGHTRLLMRVWRFPQVSLRTMRYRKRRRHVYPCFVNFTLHYAEPSRPCRAEGRLCVRLDALCFPVATYSFSNCADRDKRLARSA